MVEGQIPLDAALARLKPLFEDAAILKIAHNMKHDLLVLSRYGIDVAPIDDAMLMSYALDSDVAIIVSKSWRAIIAAMTL